MQEKNKPLVYFAAFIGAISTFRNDWGGEHPIGSFLEMAFALCMLFIMLVIAAFTGGILGEKIILKRFSFLEPVIAWTVGLTIFFGGMYLINMIPGIGSSLGNVFDGPTSRFDQ